MHLVPASTQICEYGFLKSTLLSHLCSVTNLNISHAGENAVEILNRTDNWIGNHFPQLQEEQKKMNSYP